MRFRVTPPIGALGASAHPLHPSRPHETSGIHATGIPGSPPERDRVLVATKRLAALLFALILLFALGGAARGAEASSGASAAAEARGRILGSVIESAGLGSAGGPLASAHVQLEGSARGVISRSDGSFVIEPVATGRHVVVASYVGHVDARREVVVGPGEDVYIELALAPVAFELPEVPVMENTGRVETDVTTDFELDDDFLDVLPIDDVGDAVALTPSIVAQAGQIHVRGQRGNGTDFRVDGVSVKDPLGGQAGGVSLASLENTEVIVGAMQAKHGPTLAGVINHTTREGGDHVSGQLRFETDDFGSPGKTYNDLDRVLIGLGGPTPVPRLSYYVSAQGEWSDAYPATRERRPSRRVLDFISLGDRMVNDVRLQGKLAWRPDVPTKLTLEILSNRTRMDSYFHNWTWEGWVKTFLDTLETGEVVTRRGPWASHRIDDDYVYYNAAEHTPDVDQRFTLHKLSMTRTLSGGDAFVKLKVARTRHAEERSVSGKNPWEYDIESTQDPYLDAENGELSDFFARGGDLPVWSRAETSVISVHADHTRRVGRHLFEAGALFRYNDIAVRNVTSMFVGRDLGTEIGVRDRYHVFQSEGGFYLQDTWEYEGLVLNVGARYDGYSVGEQLDPSEVSDRVKWQISPRVGIAYPVTDLDVFSFHYGRYYQYPDRHQLFENRTALDGRVIGNPDLSNETTVAYQAAIEHLFGPTVRGQFAVYFQDVYGLIDTRNVELPNSATEVPQYTNGAYASSRGFEVSLSRAFSAGFTGRLGYSFGVATGVASDAESSTALGFRYLPISEQPLNWDRRHALTAAFSISDPGRRWSLSGTWVVQSGFPFTPRERATRDVEPEVVNSRRLPGSSTLTLQASRTFSAWGRAFRVMLRADNVLDTRTVTRVSGATPTPSPAFDTNAYAVYYTETGNAGGAYLAADRDGDGEEDWVPLNDPFTISEGRALRVGVSFDF